MDSHPITMDDDACLTTSQTVAFLGLKSRETLRQLHLRGEAPPRLKISAQNWGYRRRDLKAWQQSRLETA